MTMNNRYQVFTPSNTVDLMLGFAGYKDNLQGKVFLENSFGHGDILVSAVKRYIEGAIDWLLRP